MKEEIRILIANMPAITALMTELKLLVNTMPSSDVADFTILAGRSSLLKVNKELDKELYFKLLKTIESANDDKIIKLRDEINSLFYKRGDVAVEIKQQA